MEGFDDPGVFFSDNFTPANNEQINLQAIKKKFKEFIRQFHEENFNFKYRDALKRNYNLRRYHLQVNLEDVSCYDETLADKLYKNPNEYVAIFEESAREVADELTTPRPIGEEKIEDIQIMLVSSALPTCLRAIKSTAVSQLVKIHGIVISASGVRAKATQIVLQCRGCRSTVPGVRVPAGFEGLNLPRKCNVEQAGRPNCPLDPYFIVPDKCQCVDFQVLKLQESPDSIPHGELARHIQLYCDRDLCERAVPGNRVIVTGIYCIKKVSGLTKQRGQNRAGMGVRSSYIRVLGIQVDTKGAGFSPLLSVTSEEEEAYRRFAASPNVYDRLATNIAPSIYGMQDAKRAIACLLFGGSRKQMPDGLTRRGDINVLLLGDPGTAKSQLLKFTEQVAPIGVYTSGKGSSAAGLTASVVRDPTSRNFVMEGGAMVLADGGVVCIDEFDKMREDDRVAIHEAMEQQTITIAKAGISTTLNSRCSVLAAANPIFGLWDDTKGDENIDLMPTILSRFDMIFLVRDEHLEARDLTLARHILGVHTRPEGASLASEEGDLSMSFIKKYINFCRTNCGPRLSESAGNMLKSKYVLMRTNNHQMENQDGHSAIPITVRQLEALIRVAESFAKMRLHPFANEKDVEEALRLFQVSTLQTAHSGSLPSTEGFTSEHDVKTMNKIEQSLLQRMAIGSQVSVATIVNSFLAQNFNETAINRVVYMLVRRGILNHRCQRKLLFRVK